MQIEEKNVPEATSTASLRLELAYIHDEGRGTRTTKDDEFLSRAYIQSKDFLEISTYQFP